MHNQNISKQRWLLFGVCVASFIGCIDFTIVNTALPNIQTEFNASMNNLQWVMNIFIIALSSAMVTMGRMADLYGRRKVLLIGLVIFGMSSLAAGLSTQIESLIASRLGQGLSCAILYTATGAIISNAYSVNERGKAMGILFGVNGIGLAIGPFLGGLIVSIFSWRWVFFINIPIAMLSIIICYLTVKESKETLSNQPLDWKGLALINISLSTFVLAVTQSYSWGWHNQKTILLLVLSMLSITVFYRVEQRVKTPIIEFKLFNNPLFILSAITTATLAFFYCLAFFLMPLYLTLIRGETSLTVGLLLLPITSSVAIASPIVGRLVDRFSPKVPILVGLICFIVSAWLQSIFMTQTSWVFIFIAFIVMGIGWACLLGPSTVAALTSVPEKHSGLAIGASWTLHNIGGALGLAIGMARYHSAAAATLSKCLSTFNLPIGKWTMAAIDHPMQLMATLSEMFSERPHKALEIYQQIILAGFHNAMQVLVIITTVTLVLTLVLYQKKINRRESLHQINANDSIVTSE